MYPYDLFIHKHDASLKVGHKYLTSPKIPQHFPSLWRKMEILAVLDDNKITSCVMDYAIVCIYH